MPLLTDEQVVLARQMVKRGASATDVARDFKIDRKVAWDAVVGATFSHLDEVESPVPHAVLRKNKHRTIMLVMREKKAAADVRPDYISRRARAREENELSGLNPKDPRDRRQIEREAKLRLDRARKQAEDISVEEARLTQVLRNNLMSICDQVDSLARSTAPLTAAVSSQMAVILAELQRDGMTLEKAKQWVYLLERIARIAGQTVAMAYDLTKLERQVAGQPTDIVEVRTPDARSIEDIIGDVLELTTTLKKWEEDGDAAAVH